MTGMPLPGPDVETSLTRQSSAKMASEKMAASPIPAAHFVSRLKLTAFRSYQSLDLEVGAGPVVLYGHNGAGKTNVLEALSYLSPGRGMRRAKLAEVTHHSVSGGWAVTARVHDPATGQILDVGTGTADASAPDGASERRIVRIDGQNSRGPAALAELLSVSWLTPRMDRLFQDEAPSRRRFLDRLVYGFDAAHARRVSAYERAMRERARLLKSGEGNPEWHAALEETMAGHGVAVAAARRDGVARLANGLATDAGPFPRVALAVKGSLEEWLDTMSAVEVETAFCDALKASRGRDSETGGTAIGPHRSDLEVTHLGNGLAAQQCSTGEQKALLIAIVLADARVKAVRLGAVPMLLLDEVVAHLDAEKREALFDQLLELGAQAWLTGTDDHLFAPLGQGAQFFSVTDAVLSPQKAPQT